MNKRNKDLTFYSARHYCFSKIDMIWATKEIGLLTRKIEILSKASSDHNPIMLKGSDELRKYRWRLNENFLQQSNQDFIQKEKQHFFEQI